MVVFAKVRLRAHEEAVGLLRDDERMVHVARGPSGCVMTLTVTDPERLRALHASFPNLREPITPLGPDSTTLVTHCSCPRHGLVARIEDWGGIIRWPVVLEGPWRNYDLYAADRDTVRRIVERLAEWGEVVLSQIKNADPTEMGMVVDPAAMLDGMTEAQMRALRLAVTKGYYAHPRETTLTKLAKDAGLAQSTFQEHVQKAERGLFRNWWRLFGRFLDAPK